MTKSANFTPPWLPLLNAMEQEWRNCEIEQGRNPDRYIERILFQSGRWPDGIRAPRPSAHAQVLLASGNSADARYRQMFQLT